MSYSFDIVSNIDLQEVSNAINMATKEIKTRFDLKGSSSDITLEKEEIVIIADDDYKLKSVREILEVKLVKRGVPLKGLIYGSVEMAFSGNVRQRVKLQQGIPGDKAKDIIKEVKKSGLKVQIALQDDQLRVSGKKKDDLQDVITLVKDKFKGINLQFTNYR